MTQPMLPICTVCSPELAIELINTNVQTSYKPGDTLVGRVTRTKVGAVPEAKVTVTIEGHSRAQLAFPGPGSDRTFQSTFNTLTGPVDAQVLHADAPLHVPDGSEGLSWPFAITIPALVTDVRQGGESDLYLAPNGADPDARSAAFTPPASFAYDGEFPGEITKCKAFIEYYVKATIAVARQHKGRTVMTYHDAIAPFKLTHVRFGPPVTDFEQRRQRLRYSVIAYHLIPGFGPLTFCQKTRQMLRSSKVPKLTVKFDLSLPSVLQIGNSAVLPIRLFVEPCLQKTSGSLRGIPQKVSVKSFTLRLGSHTHVQAANQIIEQSALEVELVPPNAVRDYFRVHRQGLGFSITPRADGVEEPSETLHLGELLDIRMHKYPFLTLTTHPTFTAYNVSRAYELVWELQVSVTAGNFFKLGSRHSVKVLSRAYEPLVAETGGGEAEEPLPTYRASMEEEPPTYRASMEQYLPVYAD
ncbi:hypothetical protein BJX61DRAFT_360304 [Aspergillus egyptiacus]|nr:hypothetical protein BJX61DRAFT_360304 [Aspergillus egyptiacus]